MPLVRDTALVIRPALEHDAAVQQSHPATEGAEQGREVRFITGSTGELQAQHRGCVRRGRLRLQAVLQFFRQRVLQRRQ